MAKKLNSTIGINLAFTADTDKAKRQMRELQSMLENLSTKSITNSPLKEINSDLLKAANSATKLQTQLAMATNPDTGKLDLTKFNDALKKSNMRLEDYQTDLFHLGSDGVKAFSQLAQAITLAEVPMRRANKLVDEMWTSLKNTARWQFSSSILHGLVGAVQSAYGYAQDLNESLNDIRIVTGQSVEQMADFAKEANRAAKALSTTTTEYTKASLIYYQQGLSDKEVKDRTDITIKMANAAGQSAETVSDQLTAVWNNFYDGSKSLEYYADVMTALGAATASSTEEISTGLNKFAAIAETVGLSYEYAASALATVTATTRQSADIVGTAFKTLFARIQDLELGKTLDDGTTLGKYSAALNTIGVNIKDDNDNLKEMDQILEEMAAKWNTISKDEQTALAQTVAGTRQYTQLVALMENWDFMQQNLGTSYGATGTLDEQAEIYAESWEAAKDRVQASMETIYDTIINDEFFIELSNGFAKALDGVNAFINGLGGAKGILLTIGSLVTSILAHKISGSIQTMIHNVKMQFPNVREKEIQSKTDATKVLVSGLKDLDTSSGRTMADVYERLGNVQSKYTEQVEHMSEEEQYVNKILMDRERILSDNAILASENVEKAEALAKKTFNNLYSKGQRGENINLFSSFKDDKLLSKSLNEQILKTLIDNDIDTNSPIEYQQRYKENIVNTVYERVGIKPDTSDAEAIELMKKQFGNLGLSVDEAEKKYAKFLKLLKNTDSASVEELNLAIKELSTGIGNDVLGQMIALRAEIEKLNDPDIIQAFEEYEKAVLEFGNQSEQAKVALEQFNRLADEHGKMLNEIQEKPMKLSEAFSRMTGAVMAVGQAITTVTGIIDVFNDENATGKDKVIALIGGLTMLVPTIISVIPAFTGMAAAGTATSIALWPLTLAAIVLTGVIAGIVVAIDAVKKRSPEAQLKRTKEEAKKLAEELDEIKNKTQEIKSIFDQYDDVVAKLDDCVKGTAEWKEALNEVNQVVLDLMATYPELLSMPDLFERDSETGMLTINEEKRNEVLELQNQRELNKQAQVLRKNIEVNRQTADNEWEKVFNPIKSKTLSYATQGNIETITQDSILTNEFMSNIIKLPDEEQRKDYIIKSLKENQHVTGMTELDEISYKNQGYTDEEIDLMKANALDSYADQLINSINYLVPHFNDLGKSAEDISNSIRNANQLIVDSMLDDSATADEKAIFANYLESEKQTRANDFKDNIGLKGNKDRAIDRNKRDELEKQWKRYALINGIENAQGLAKNAIAMVNGKQVIRYRDDKGDIATVSLEDFYNSLALDNITTDKDIILKKYQDTLSTMYTGAGKTEQEGVSQLISNQNFEGFTEGFFKEAKDASQMAEKLGFEGDITKLAQAIGLDIVDEEGNAIDADILKEQIDKLIQSTQQAYDDLPSKFSNSVKEVFDEFKNENEGVISKLNVAQQTQVGNMMQTAFNTAGTEGLNTVSQFFEQLNLAEMETFLGTSFDWATMSAADLEDQFMELGIVIDDEAKNKLPQLIEIFRKSLNPSLKEIQNQVKNQQDVVKGLKNLGDTISSEDFDKLGDQYRDYFQLMADGSYKLIKSAELLNKELNKTYQQQLIDNIEEKNTEIIAFQSAVTAREKNKLLTTGNMGTIVESLDLFTKDFTENDWAEYKATGKISTQAFNTLREIVNAISTEELQNKIDLDTKEINESIEGLGSVSTLKELQNWRKDSGILADNEAYQTALLGLMSSATNFESVDYILKNSGLDQTSNDYLALQANALINLGSAYDSCAYEIERVQQLMEEDPNSPMLKVAIQALSTAVEAQTKIQEISHSDIYDVDRQYEQDLEDLNEEIEKANEKIDEGIGAGVIGSFEAIATTLDKKTDLIKEKIRENSTEISKSQQKLLDIVADGIDGGFTFSFNEDGTISNYDEIMSYLTDSYLSAKTLADTTGDVTAKDSAAELKLMIDQLNDYIPVYDKLVDSNKKANEELDKTSKEKIQNTIEKFEKAQDDFDSYVDTLESYKDFMQLIDDNKALSESLNAINDINKQAFDTAKIAYEQIRDTAGSTPEQVAAAQKEMLDSMKAWTESLKEVVLNELKGFDKEFANAMLGDMTFDEMAQNLQYAQSLQEEYLTDTNKIYETNKLINEVQKQIDATTNNVAKQKLKNFIEQTKELEKQNKLSKFELDIRKAEYDVMLAEIALQEAQQAKSAVRLRRDSEGNFGYVYTADAGQVADAEQRLADAQNALYNVGLEGANKYAQRQVQITQEAQDAISQLTQQWINGEIESEEEYKRRVAETTEYYVAKYEEASNLLSKASAVDASIASESWAASFAEQFKNLDDFESKLSEYTEKSYKSVDGYKDTIKNTVGSEDGGLTEIFDKTKASAEALASAIGGGGSTATESDTPPVNETVEEYGKKSQEAVDNGGQALEENMNNTADNANALTTALSGGESEGGLNRALDMVNQTTKKTIEVFEDLKLAIQQTVGEAYALRRHLQFMSENTFSVKYVVEQNVVSSASSYDTGGYTGQWGSAGKLAVLHEKEIVLNQDDTVNLLASIELLRGIVDTLDVQTASQMMGGILTSPGYNNNYSNPIEQNIKIEASFPAVQDRNEIEEAFNNLINKASQYANRK